MDLERAGDTFVNRGRWHPAVRVVVYLIVFTAVAMVLIIPVTAPLLRQDLTPEEVSAILLDPDRPLLIAVTWLQLLAALVATFWMTRVLDRQPIGAVGLRRYQGWTRDLAAGLAAGAVLVLPPFVVLTAVGLARIGLGSGRAGWALAFGLLTMVPVALSEEILFRGYILRNLTQAFGAWPALLLSSACFSVLHLSNPGADRSALPLVNIFLAGVLLAYPYLRTGSLWLSVGLHFSWNFTQSSLLGMPVSGLALPGVIQTRLLPPFWLSGGAFGPEGSILAALSMAGGLVWLVRRYGGRRPVGGASGSVAPGAGSPTDP